MVWVTGATTCEAQVLLSVTSTKTVVVIVSTMDVTSVLTSVALLVVNPAKKPISLLKSDEKFVDPPKIQSPHTYSA